MPSDIVALPATDAEVPKQWLDALVAAAEAAKEKAAAAHHHVLAAHQHLDKEQAAAADLKWQATAKELVPGSTSSSTMETATTSPSYVDTIIANFHIQADNMMEEIHMDISGPAATPTTFYSNKTPPAPLPPPLASPRPPSKNNSSSPGNGNGSNNNQNRNNNHHNGGSGDKNSNITVASHNATTNEGRGPPPWPAYVNSAPTGQQWSQAFMVLTGPYTPLGFVLGQQQLYQQVPPTPPPGWAPWNGVGWDQQSLVNSFSIMALQPPHNSVNDWVADSDASHHTTPLNSASPSSIVAGNGSTLPITSVGDWVIPGPFYLNNILLPPNIVQSVLSGRRFTTDNWCSIEFDPFGLSVKDLTTRNMIARSNSTGLLYTLCLLSSTTSSRTSPCAMSAIVVPRILAAIAMSTWHRCLGHPDPDALSSMSRSSFISCTSTTHDFIMLVSWANTSDCHFLVHRVVRKKPLIYYILIFGHLRLLVCLVRNTTWSFLMISLIICGLFRLNRNLTPSPSCPIFLLMLLLSSAALSKLYNATTDVSLTTRPPKPSSCPKVPSCGCRAPTHPHKMVKLGILFAPLTMSFARC
jgi:hypothetical protein